MRPHGRPAWGAIRRVAVVGGAALGLIAAGFAQRATAQEPHRPPSVQPSVGGPARGEAEGGHGWGRRWMWGRGMMEPTAEDRRPLAPGEEQALRDFVKEKLPKLGQELAWAEARNPSAARQGFTKLVPRLRQLQRIYAESPERAELIAQHATNQVRIEMLRRAWLKAKENGRELIESQMREFVAGNVNLEADLLNCWAEELESGHESSVAERVDELLQAGADLAAEPKDVRELAERYAGAADDQARAELREKLTAAVGRQLDRQIAGLRRRAEELRADAPNIVDRRMHPLLQPPKPRKP